MAQAAFAAAVPVLRELAAVEPGRFRGFLDRARPHSPRPRTAASQRMYSSATVRLAIFSGDVGYQNCLNALHRPSVWISHVG
jgi:hypothetical protein